MTSGMEIPDRLLSFLKKKKEGGEGERNRDQKKNRKRGRKGVECVPDYPPSSALKSAYHPGPSLSLSAGKERRKVGTEG